MRRKIALVLTATTLALGGSVVTAGAADARRNLGGTAPAGATCYTPGGSQVRSAQALAQVGCFCYVAPAPSGGPRDGERNVGGLLPDMVTTCPPGVLKNGTPHLP